MIHVQKPYNFYGFSVIAMLGGAALAMPYYALATILQFFYPILQPFTFTGALVIFGAVVGFISFKMRSEIHADSYFKLSAKFWLSHNGKMLFKSAKQRFLLCGDNQA